jgi:hypothetical protein
MVRRAEADRQPWHNLAAARAQAHDQPQEVQGMHHAFVARRHYCIETLSYSCGRIIAWAKFSVAESPTNILDFFQRIYPDAATRPSYLAIDKACQVLRHLSASVPNAEFVHWMTHTRLIVDTYHFRNHSQQDELCQEFCNPTPALDEDPNLVQEVIGNDGQPHLRRAFNTQVSVTFFLT